MMPDGLRCMRISAEQMSATDGEQHCQEEGEDGHLVRISSDQENAAVANLVRQDLGSPPGGVWIGLNDRSDEGAYVWYDGSDSDYRNWGPGQPNNSDHPPGCCSGSFNSI